MAPGLQHDLGVGTGREGGALSDELPPQLTVVVQLAVVGKCQGVLGERLVRRVRQVDDRQPGVRQRH